MRPTPTPPDSSQRRSALAGHLHRDPAKADEAEPDPKLPNPTCLVNVTWVVERARPERSESKKAAEVRAYPAPYPKVTCFVTWVVERSRSERSESKTAAEGGAALRPRLWCCAPSMQCLRACVLGSPAADSGGGGQRVSRDGVCLLACVNFAVKTVRSDGHSDEYCEVTMPFPMPCAAQEMLRCALRGAVVASTCT